MATVHRIQPSEQDLSNLYRHDRDVVRGKVPFKLFYLVPESVRDEFMKTLTYCAATPIALSLTVPWEELRVDTREENGKSNFQEGTTLKEVVPDLYRAEDPWWAVVPIPRTNMSKRALRAFIRTALVNAPESTVTYDPKTFDVVGQHPYEEEDEMFSAVSQIATTRLPPGLAGNGNNSVWYGRRSQTVRSIQRFQPLPAVRVRTPDGIFEDVCLLCSNYMYKLAGDCWFGCNTCDDILKVIGVDGMFAKLRAFDAIASQDDSLPNFPMRVIDVQEQPGKDAILRVRRVSGTLTSSIHSR